MIVCPAFPENGRSVYQGHLFVADRLLNESGMEHHPLSPMTDADLRRVLAAQSARAVGHVPAQTVRAGAAAISRALGDAHMIVDAISDADLIEIGRAAQGAPLPCGGSGIALGLPANFGYAAAQPDWSAVTGPGAVMSGSCSRATRAQVAHYLTSAPARQITAEAALDRSIDLDEIAGWVMQQSVPPSIYASADPDDVAAAQARFGAGQVAQAIEAVFADLAARLLARGLRRLVVAGGETSGAVVQGLGAEELDIGPRAAAGVPLLHWRNMALALKSGNFGPPGFFAETLARMEQAT